MWTAKTDQTDWADAKAGLSLRWAHMSFCWFFRAPAQIVGESGASCYTFS